MSRFNPAQEDAAKLTSEGHSIKEAAVTASAVLPRITMPHAGPRIFFWRAGPMNGDNLCPPMSERIAFIRNRLTRLATAVNQIEARIVRGDLCATAMRTEYDALSVLLDKTVNLESRILSIREVLSVRKNKFLSSWRVTEREILATDARQLHYDLRGVLGGIKRCQVDISGQLLDEI